MKLKELFQTTGNFLASIQIVLILVGLVGAAFVFAFEFKDLQRDITDIKNEIRLIPAEIKIAIKEHELRPHLGAATQDEIQKVEQRVERLENKAMQLAKGGSQ